jgi:hypothetical protein
VFVTLICDVSPMERFELLFAMRPFGQGGGVSPAFSLRGPMDISYVRPCVFIGRMPSPGPDSAQASSLAPPWLATLCRIIA